ncbi:MAG: hypothetical protein V1872_02865 [bacterium]
MNKITRFFLKGLPFFILIAAVLSCAYQGKNKNIVADKNQLKFELWEVAGKYAEAKTQKRYEDMYNFQTPEFKDIVSLEKYVEDLKREYDVLTITGYTIQDINIIDVGKIFANVTISFNLKQQIRFLVAFSAPEEEKWEYRDNKWYFVENIKPEFNISGS